MKTGTNTLISSWGPFDSNEIIIQKNEETNTETTDQFQSCQNLKDNIRLSEVPHYCATITIVLGESDDSQYSCAELKKLFAEIDLSIPCASVMNIGIAFIYVPRYDASKYLTQIKSLPEVQEATIDSN